MRTTFFMPGLQALRFFAALGVFLHHLVGYATRSGTVPDGVVDARVGSTGVIAFFVLSGFLMAMISDNAKPLQFLKGRALRIFPGFWLAIAIAFPLKLYALGTLPDYNWFAVLSLFPNGRMHYPLNVEWTLVFEVFFYSVVTTLCFVPSIRVRQAIVALWALAVFVFGFSTRSTALQEIPVSFANIVFIIGMATWWAQSRLPFRGVWSAALGASILIGGFYLREAIPEPWPWTIQAIGGAILILTAARSTFFQAGGQLIRLGDTSYGIYLIHAPLMVVLFALIQGKGWFVVLLVGLLTAMASIMFGAVEHRLYKRLNRLLTRDPPRAPTEAPPSAPAACADLR